MYGLNLSHTEYEEIAVNRITKKHRKKEAELMNICWWDYRAKHPTWKTYLFAGTFRETFRRLYARHIDSDVGDNVRGYSRPDPLDNRPNRGKKAKISTPTYFWKARQYADEMGAPYDFYITNAAEIALRRKNSEAAIGRMKTSDSRKLMLSASNLYEVNIVADVYERWQEMQRYAPRFARDERYIIKPGEEVSELQKAHEKHVIQHALKMSHPQYCLANAINRGHVRREVVERLTSYFSERVLFEVGELSQS